MLGRRFGGRSVWGVWMGVPALALIPLFGLPGHGATGVADARYVDPDPDPDAVVTFARDVAPILQQRCQICHQPGSIGPMSLMTYEDVRRWAPLVKQQVVTRNMPPYHYDTDVGIQQLKNDWRLTDEEIATIVSWIDSDQPLGDPEDMPPPVTWPKAGEYRLQPVLGRPPDLVISSQPFTVPAHGQDLWWRPVVPSGITEDRCIAAIETKPSAQGWSVVHHGNTSFRGGEGEFTGGRLSEYALGKIGEIIPEDACRIAPKGSSVSFDIHYYPNGTEVKEDVLDVGIWFHPEHVTPQSRHRQTLSLYGLESGNGDFVIPPNGTLVTQGYRNFDTPVRIDSWQPHGHLRLRAARLETLDPATGRRQLVSMVSNWHPGWHHSHVYEEDVAPLLPAGAFMVLTQWYDNTSNNPHNPDPEQWVGAGDRTTDEMSHMWIAITHLDDETYEKLVAEREAARPQQTPRRGRPVAGDDAQFDSDLR